MALYTVRGLRKTYRVGDVVTTALDGIDLEVERGEFTAVAGPSGSGKSTLLHLLGALDRPDGGEVVLEGRRIDTLGRQEAARMRLEHLGFIFQAYNLIPVLSALENAAFVLELRGMSKAERERRAKIIAAEGEFQAAEKITQAAEMMQKFPMSLQLRYLQTLVEIGGENNTTTIFPIPMDLINALTNKK